MVAFPALFSFLFRIIDHLKLTFVADKPPPSRVAYQELLMAAAAGGECSS
jgi:hypothetical protein